MEQLRFTFAKAEIPEFPNQYFSQNRYITFGNNNRYPDYLIDLYNGAAKHAAIINGKCTYIVGSGFVTTDPSTQQFLDKANEKETWNQLIKKLCKDIEIFGGFYLQCIKKNNGVGFNFYHVSYDRIRVNDDNTKFWYRKDWKFWTGEQIFKAFTPNTKDHSTIFFYKENGAKKQPYALPNYLAALNLIEAEKAVSEAILTNAKSGFTATKHIAFIGQEPIQEKKSEIVKRLEERYSGESGNRLVVEWVNDEKFATKITDLGQTDLTKEDYTAVNNLITNNLFAGHGVTHPLLFGIQQEGKLGGATELREAFYIFKNTYANAKQINIEDVVKYLATANGVVNTDIKLKDVEPIELTLNPVDFKEMLPKEWVIEKFGIDEKYFTETISQGAKSVNDAINALSPLVANKVLESMEVDEIRRLVNLPSKTAPIGANGMPIVVGAAPTTQNTNDALVNLTGRQQQGLLRISRLFGNGKLTKAQAAIQLKGFGFTDEQINQYLGVDEDPTTEDMKFVDESEDAMIAMFSSVDFGEDATTYNVISQQNYMEQDEFKFAFTALTELSEIESKIVALLKEKPDTTIEQLAQTFELSVEQITTITDKLKDEGVLEVIDSGVIKVTPNKPFKTTLPEIKIMYSYEKRLGVEGATLLPTSRPFCKKLVALSETKLFSRQDIQKISERLGYSVFKRAGGFWNNNGKIEYQCRHGWVQKVVTKKN